MVKVKLIPKTLLKSLSYNKETGEFKWIALCTSKNKKAGTIDDKGYIVIKHKDSKYQAHRIAWALVYGRNPPRNLQIDHKNGIKTDNRFCNLRLVTQSTNQKNRYYMRNFKERMATILFLRQKYA